MRRLRHLLLLLFALALLPAGAHAHLDMTKPVSRYGPDILKRGPCGASGGVRSGNINYFEPGETIDVEWNEYVDHPSHYRIAFDENGDDDFVDPATMMEFYSNDAVLVDEIADKPAGDPVYRTTVTLPDVECDNCTLQVIQVMYDKPPYTVGGNDIYYQCADLVLRKGGGPSPTDGGSDIDAGADASVDAGSNTGADAGTGAGGSSGCAASRGDTAWIELGACLMAFMTVCRLARGRRLPV